MKLEGLTLETQESGAVTTCTLLQDGALEARGAVKDGRMVGVWSTFAEDGSVRSSVDLTKVSNEVELDADVLCEELATALLQAWLLTFESPPAWMVESGALAVPWDELEDDSPEESVAEFPFFLHGALHPDPLVQELCLRSLHRGMVDDGELFPAAVRAVPLLGLLLEQPGAPVALTAHVLLDIAVAVSEAAEETEEDLQEDDAEDEVLRPTLRALAATLPQVEKVLARSRGTEAKLLRSFHDHVSKALA